MSSITINSKTLEVEPGTTILKAAQQAGVEIPTLCKLENHSALGACRVCVVEVEGAKTLMASCATPVRDGMVVYTNSPKVRRMRKTIVDLLLSEHEGNCQYCDRSFDCELRKLAYDLGIQEPRYAGEKPVSRKDLSTPALVRDSEKCVKCRRCVTVCNEVQQVGALFPQFRGYETQIAPAFATDLDQVSCVQCGQCAAVCPVGAITERNHMEGVWTALADPDLHVIVQTAPAIRAALGECFGMKPGSLVTGRMVTALKELGFDAVFDTNFAADLTIMEEGTELLTRLQKTLIPDDSSGKAPALPMFTSCSPAWIKYAESFYPDFLPNISTCKSPQQMFGAIAKTYYAQQMGIPPEKMIVVSVMPCTAKKFEANRPEMNDSGVVDVDYVLTTRELGRMIQAGGLDFSNLPNSEMDNPLGYSTGAADIFANTGGVMEAALRTAYEIVTGREFPVGNLHLEAVSGLKGVKEAELTISEPLPDWAFLDGVTLRVAVAHGLGNASSVLDAIRNGNKKYHFVEIMTCPGGCIGGGGQPRFTSDDVRLARMEAIYQEDEGKAKRKSHENPDVMELYEKFLGSPLGKQSHHLLHTRYTERQRV